MKVILKTMQTSGNKKISIVFFGNEKLATGIQDVQPIIHTAIINDGFEIEKVITGPLDELGSHESKLAVLIAYGRMIPSSILEQFPLGIINVHPSLLPLYRGPSPIEQAILDGADKTGVSIMRITREMDEGPIYKQKTFLLTGSEKKPELTAKLQALGAELLLEVLSGIVNGNLEPRKQPHPERASYTPKLLKDNGLINWSKSAVLLEREIRAYAGWPKSRTKLGDLDVIISDAKVIDKQGKPGKLVKESDQLMIYCGKHALEIEKLQPVGKKEMSIQEFLRGYSPRLN